MKLDRPIVVSAHAVEQHRLRHRDDRPHNVIVKEIEDGVRHAYDYGHVLNNKPKSWRLYREKGRKLEEGQRFVGDPESDRGWIVVSEREAVTVVTTLKRTASAA